MAEFIDCTSLNFSYNSMGIVTVSYTVIHNEPRFVVYKEIDAGNQQFSGYVTNASMNEIIGTQGWYETHVTLVATTN